MKIYSLICLVLLSGCSSLTPEPSEHRPIEGCMAYREGEYTTYERVFIIGDSKEGDWMLIKPDSSDKTIQNVAKKLVTLMPCPNNFMMNNDPTLIK